jgi:hypothetical protein
MIREKLHAPVLVETWAAARKNPSVFVPSDGWEAVDVVEVAVAICYCDPWDELPRAPDGFPVTAVNRLLACSRPACWDSTTVPDR